ncbi:DEAD/DEAH box helicase [Gracilibacillus kekensis]|uniref:Superfamily II DNA or RNA helicase, SNF2 family n=1 Tax=Gracilibacillus kekensis TaxID=1027249 RepID=A0A1M7L5M5_9BACI|nr:DEAD/DEAH box helicase [Gracilibacillus kekensis]SHM73383.1 Superfamily II DNA or RNA helicase, SNF2 family [Gracilibacillus kekensis]
MDIKLNQKIIKELCGTISFKRGNSFYQANRVTLHKYTSDRCEATVEATEDFHVTVDKKADGGFRTECTCPTLPSFQNDCQHIAAVLLTIYEQQQQDKIDVAQEERSTNQVLTEGLMNIFQDSSSRGSGQQRHFENRQQLNLVFTCKPVTIDKQQYLFGIEIHIGPIKIKNIRDFLKRVNEGRACQLSRLFRYDPASHYFQTDTDAVIQQLIYVIRDEQIYLDALEQVDKAIDTDVLLVPPSSGDRLLPLLTTAPLVKLEYKGKTFEGLPIINAPLPLTFDFSETNQGEVELKIKGLNKLVVMHAYRLVLYNGKLIQLDKEQNEQLSNLKQMLTASKTDRIPIPSEQMNAYMEKVIPGLRKLGDVTLARTIRDHFEKTPLIAKLYLDRVKNRLLAGLEFHYESIIIHPLEQNEIENGPMLVRDTEKENEILKIMNNSGFAKTEGGYFIHNEELEYEFLEHFIPELQGLVQIYATTAVKNRIFREKAHPKIRVKLRRERTNWLEFKFEMQGIPDQDIRELLQALEEKRKYYRLRNGSLMSLESREFEEIRRFLNTVPAQDDDLEKGLQVPIVRGLGLLDAVDDRDTFTIEKTFRTFLDKLKNPDEEAYDVPEGLSTVLRDYQKHGYRWMKTMASYRFGGVLADDMGLGKTLQSIAFILSELEVIRRQKRPALIVCPSSLTYNWQNEWRKFAPELNVLIIDGTKKERSHLQHKITNSDVIITSYPLLRRDVDWYSKQTFHTSIFDEAQAFKNPYTQTAKAVKKINADYRFALTGTPIENSLEELWSIYYVVFPELFLGLKEFSNLTRTKIARRVRPFMLRRKKDDVLEELPKKIESTESMELLPEQKKIYAAYLAKLRHDTLKHLDKDTLRKNRIKILAGLTRLRQICCHPSLFVDKYNGGSAKFEQLKQIIEESQLAGRRVLIFSQFTKMLKLIGNELARQGLSFFYLDGQTPSEERVETCYRFNEGERDLFLISLKAGGTGLNLTGADTVILYDIWWNPAVEEQAADRAHRIGQKNEVQVIKLVAHGTIEEKMNALQEKKKHLTEEIVDTKEHTFSTLTDEDIKEILMI